MAKKVEVWQTDRGLFFTTEEEALESDRRNAAWKKFQELAGNKIGSQGYVSTSFDLMWKNREVLLPLLKAGIEA